MAVTDFGGRLDLAHSALVDSADLVAQVVPEIGLPEAILALHHGPRTNAKSSKRPAGSVSAL